MFSFGQSRRKISKEIFPGVFYFPEHQMLDCGMYILKDESENLMLVDAGNGLSLDATLGAIHKLGLESTKISKVIVTHEHLDHVLGLYPLLEKLSQNPPEIMAHSITAGILEEGNEEQICPRSLGIKVEQFGLKIKPIPVKSLKEGDSVFHGKFTFAVLETPGHSLGSASFYDKTNKILFPGDVVFPQGSFGRYDFPGGSLQILKESIKRLTDLDVDVLGSGHMAPVTKNTNASIKLSYRNITGMMY